MSCFVIILVFLIKNCVGLRSFLEIEDNFMLLSNNLIENLRVDPYLKGELPFAELSQTSKEFIDKHVERFTELALTSRKEFSRSKRSLAQEIAEHLPENQDYNTYIKPEGEKPISRTGDVIFFKHRSKWHTALLTQKETKIKTSNVLNIFKFENNKLSPITNVSITNGTQIATISLQNSTIIVVAENAANLRYTTIYELDNNDKFGVLQKVNGSRYSDVNLWEDNGNVFMSLVGFMEDSSVTSSSHFYKWRGRHFDVQQDQDFLEGVTSITSFNIGDEGYLALARSKPLIGEDNVYSDILKYNVQTEKYELFTKILTYACKDMKYFEIETEKESRRKEGFLVIANFYQMGISGNKIYKTQSTIYKLIDNYFYPFQSVSLNGVRQWEIVKNETGEVLLIALTLDGLRTFQYDGWMFVESKIHFKGEQIKHHVQDERKMHLYKIGNANLLVIPTKNNEYQLFNVTFTATQQLEQTFNELLEWCLNTRKNMEVIDESNNILGQSRRGDIEEELESASQTDASDLDKLISNVNKQNSKLKKAENILKNSLQSSKRQTIDRDIAANYVHIKSTGDFTSLSTPDINKHEIDSILQNVLDTNEGFYIESDVKFDYLRSDEGFELTRFNEHPIEKLIYKNEDNILEKVTITGSAIFKDDITIANLSDNAIADPLLLQKIQQKSKSIKRRQIREEVDGKKGDRNEKVKSVKTMKTKNLIVGGFLNDVNLPTLEKYALKKSGKQDITAETYYIDRVESELLDTDRLSDASIPDDLILITKPNNYTLRKSIKFTSPLTVNKLTAYLHLDSISVTPIGTLDLLLKNSKQQQYIPSLKHFENLNILNPIDIRSKINNKYFEKINPTVKVDTNIEVKNDVRISGDVVIEELLKSVDILSKGLKQDSNKEGNIKDKHVKSITETSSSDIKLGNKTVDEILKEDDIQSMVRVVKFGIKLLNENIDVPIKFTEHINLPKLNADLINGEDVKNWVVAGAKEPQAVTGWKTFDGDLEITGNTNIFKINNIDIDEFELDVLKINDDQVVTGKHHVKNMIILGNLQTNNTQFGKSPWKNVITTNSNQTVDGIITINNLFANLSSIENLKISGLINDVDFTKLVKDAVLINNHSKVFGTKTFKNLEINELELPNEHIQDRLLKDVNINNITLENTHNLNEVIVEKVYFKNHLNNIHKSKFKSEPTEDTDGKILVEGDHEFDELVVYGTLFLESNQLNGVDLDEIEENTIKIDESHTFSNAEFKKTLYVPGNFIHTGQIENLDVENIFENDKEESQTILDKITFLDDVIINGTVKITGELNGVKILDLCKIHSNVVEDKKLTIEGNVYFVKGPRIAMFNNITENEISDKVWFTDRPATLKGKVQLLGNVTLREDMHLEGLLNDIALTHLSTTYLSKTKDQNISANLNFRNTTIFLNDVTTPQLFVAKEINKINLKEFINSIFLHSDQLFEDKLYFEDITTETVLEGNYLVNKLNLDSEVMRYDRPNLITGPKSFRNLHVDALRGARSGLKVQEVDLTQWLDEAILTEGVFKIRGTKTFQTVDVKRATSLMGRFNKMKLDTLMLKRQPQNITGRKMFSTLFPNKLNFKALKIRGLINGKDFSQVIQNQANKNLNNTFETAINFEKNVTSHNVIFQKRYNGINVRELLNNITNLASLNHLVDKYQNLTKMADLVDTSLKDQAYYLDYFKLITKPTGIDEMFSINCDLEKRIVGFNKKNKVMKFFDWNQNQEVFNECCQQDLTYSSYVNNIVLEGKEVVYTEQESESKNEDNTHTGTLISCNNGVIQQFGKFLTRGTLFLKSFEIANKNLQCLLFVEFSFNINILCSGSDRQFHLHQTIKIQHPVLASIAQVDNLPYLITIHKGVQNKTNIWKLDKKDQFQVDQTYYEHGFKGEPISVSAITLKEGIFFAVVYKNIPNTNYFGEIIIRRYDYVSKTFVMFQKLKPRRPTQVLFSQLPTDEIVLYVTNQDSLQPFMVYIYEGASRFVKKINNSRLPESLHMQEISIEDQQFLVLKHKNSTSLLQAVFVGRRG